MTGRIGAFSLRADEVDDTATPATTFSVFRLKRDILRRSAIGVLATARSVDSGGAGANYAYRVDGTFGFYDNMMIDTYLARTRSEGLSGGDVSYRAQLDYNADRYGVQLEQLAVGANIQPRDWIRPSARHASKLRGATLQPATGRDRIDPGFAMRLIGWGVTSAVTLHC